MCLLPINAEYNELSFSLQTYKILLQILWRSIPSIFQYIYGSDITSTIHLSENTNLLSSQRREDRFMAFMLPTADCSYSRLPFVSSSYFLLLFRMSSFRGVAKEQRSGTGSLQCFSRKMNNDWVITVPGDVWYPKHPIIDAEE